MSFVRRKIAGPSDQNAWPSRVVYRADELAQLREVAAYADAARRAADGVLEHARQAAREREARSARERDARHRRADAALLSRAVALEAAFRAQRDALRNRMERVLDAALQGALRRIASDIPAAERIRIVADELRRQVEPGPTAELHVAATDAAACRSAGLELPWPVQVDESLPPGICRLSVARVEWTLAFEMLIETLLKEPESR
jgi:HrpE/YscL/FliH and V-type ATPase subunit E